MARPQTRNGKALKAITSSVGGDLDMTKAIKLRMEGQSYGNIAKIIGCNKSNIIQRLKPFFGKDLDIPAFKTHRADMFAGQQLRVLSAITDADVKKASLRDKVIAAATLYDKERLERGQSTNNTSLFFHVVNEAPDLPGEKMGVVMGVSDSKDATQDE